MVGGDIQARVLLILFVIGLWIVFNGVIIYILQEDRITLSLFTGMLFWDGVWIIITLICLIVSIKVMARMWICIWEHLDMDGTTTTQSIYSKASKRYDSKT